MVRDISLTLRGGEITGVYGFMGCGQIELGARAVRQGRRCAPGELTLDGKPVKFRIDRGGSAGRHRLSCRRAGA